MEHVPLRPHPALHDCACLCLSKSLSKGGKHHDLGKKRSRCLPIGHGWHTISVSGNEGVSIACQWNPHHQNNHKKKSRRRKLSENGKPRPTRTVHWYNNSSDSCLHHKTTRDNMLLYPHPFTTSSISSSVTEVERWQTPPSWNSQPL